jgi:hypothetical protein
LFLRSSEARALIWLVNELGEARAVQRVDSFGEWAVGAAG